MRLLYVYKKDNSESIETVDFKINKMTPSVFKGYYIEGEKKSIKVSLMRFYFSLITFGKANIFYAISKSGELMHTSYVIPKCFKFPFLMKNEYAIGPCHTYKEYRGQGIYPCVLRFIVRTVGCDDTNFYMSVDSENVSSIRGIEKSGFKKCGIVKKTRILKRYYIQKKEC